MVGGIKKLVSMITKLHQNDPFRIRTTDQLLQKLYNMGLISTKNSLAACDKITASAFCRRRLPVVMVRLKMSQTLREAVTFIEQGHVRVGSDTINDPAFMVTRNMEDFVTWVDSSKIRRHIQKYNDALDDFDLLGN
jgi:U3 small nucleolar ribonucleoprotein protein IMP3